VVHKIRATNKIYHKIIGTIDNKEKFEAVRLAMATSVWDSMKASESRECRNCHTYHAMDFSKQSRRAAE